MKSLISANLAAISTTAGVAIRFAAPENDNARLQTGAEGFAKQTSNAANASLLGNICQH